VNHDDPQPLKDGDGHNETRSIRFRYTGAVVSGVVANRGQ